MQIIGEFVFLVMVDVAAHYICKWLDQDKKTVSLPVNRQERKRDHSPPAVVSWYIFANHSATLLYHHFSSRVKISFFCCISLVNFNSEMSCDLVHQMIIFDQCIN